MISSSLVIYIRTYLLMSDLNLFCSKAIEVFLQIQRCYVYPSLITRITFDVAVLIVRKNYVTINFNYQYYNKEDLDFRTKP